MIKRFCVTEGSKVAPRDSCNITLSALASHFLCLNLACHAPACLNGIRVLTNIMNGR